MRQPRGFERKGSEDLVCQLIKSLYGLKQSPLVWYKELHSFLVSLGFDRCRKEYCIYVRRINGGLQIVVCYVDDLTLVSPDLEVLIEIKRALAKKYKITDLGEISYMLKMEIKRDRKNKLLTISQKKYIDDVLQRFNASDLPSSPTPQTPGLKLVPGRKLTEAEIKAQPYPYRQLVGCFQYLVRGTRPDIANAVRELSKYLTCFNATHFKEARRLLQYLKHTQTHGLVFDGTNGLTIEVFSDASFGNKEENRKSITGYILRLANATVIGRSQAQKSVTLSTTEAELMAASEATKEAQWVRWLITELGFKVPAKIPLWCDNTATIDTIKNAGNHPSTKHIETRNLFLREIYEKGYIDLSFCKSEDQIADIMTKALPRFQFEKLREQLGVAEVLPCNVPSL